MTSPCRSCGLPGCQDLCPRCRRLRPPQLSTQSGFLYGGQLAQAIWRLKYAGAAYLGRPLGALLARQLGQRLDPGQEALVAVPLHPRRLRQRGYNQAWLLAQGVAGVLRIPLLRRALRRCQDSPPQVQLSRQARRQNLLHAFQSRSGAVTGRRLLLVDDVMTSGATAEACSRALLAAGAVSVSVLTLARAVP